ncbi:unnamed protein product [Cochlearia groenlandica]
MEPFLFFLGQVFITKRSIRVDWVLGLGDVLQKSSASKRRLDGPSPKKIVVSFENHRGQTKLGALIDRNLSVFHDVLSMIEIQR